LGRLRRRRQRRRLADGRREPRRGAGARRPARSRPRRRRCRRRRARPPPRPPRRRRRRPRRRPHRPGGPPSVHVHLRLSLMVGLPTLIATFVAGLGSFLNPCSLPLLPAYLSYAGGISAADLVDPERRHRHRGRLVGGTLLFVAGFGAVFVLLGIGAGGLGRQVREAERPVEIVGGAAMVVLGLALAGVLRSRWLERGRRLELPTRLRGAGLWSAFPLGAVFAIGWTPCVGPYLASALTLAAVS